MKKTILAPALSLALALGGTIAAAQEKTAGTESTKKADNEKATPASGPQVLFRNIADEAGITFEHLSAPEKKYIIESMSGGVALVDINNDDLLDVFFLNSLTIDTADQPEAAPSALYKNLGNGRFEDISEKAGVRLVDWAQGVCAADVDNNGFRDFYVTTLGNNKLFLNQGDETFRDVSAAAGVVGGGWSTGCGFADYDRDGDLDLFVSRYVELDLANLPVFGEGTTCRYHGILVQCGPRGLPGTTDLLFRNDGSKDGVPVFTEVSKAAGVHDPEEFFGLGIAWFDVNEDGWLDLYVANDSHPGLLYVNQQDGTFVEDAFPLGVAVSEDGGEQGCMGVAVGDYRNEGRFSLFVTNFSEEYNALYHNEGSYFTDVSFRSATAPSSLRYVGWGTAWLDYDNDGWLDLIVVNGHVYPQLDMAAKLGASAPYSQRRLLYRNKRDGTFEEVGEQYGLPFTEEKVGRGLVIGDIDNDGRIDVVVNDMDGRPQVFRNEMEDVGNYLIVGLKGKAPLPDAIGAVVKARVKTSSGELRMQRLVQSGASYLSQHDFRQHFGLGDATKVDVEVVWPDGTMTTRAGVDANQVLVVEQE